MWKSCTWLVLVAVPAWLVGPSSGQDIDNKYVVCPTVNLDPVILKGKQFFHSITGEYFPVKGVAYYPRPNTGDLSLTNSVDFFTEDFRDLWQADIEHFKTLGVNTIRIYAVDPSQNHDAFMCALQEAGIYVMVGLLADCENCGIGPNAAPSCYPPSLKERGEYIINEFSKYPNTLVFSAGNEVTLYAQGFRSELNAPCQKKFLRDMRSYVQTCSADPLSILPRQVPIGMVNWDRERELQTLYFNCRTDPNDAFETPEWYGLNAYLHCDPAATSIEQLGGWNTLRDNFRSYNIPVPVIVSEYGCREPGFPSLNGFEAQRTWLQVDALYSSSFVDEFAGGIAFEFSAEKQVVDSSTDQGEPWPYNGFMKMNYGMGYYTPVDCDHITTPCEYVRYPEFDLLRTKLAQVSGQSLVANMDSYNPSLGPPPVCPVGLLAPIADFEWPADDEPDLPCYQIATDRPTMSPTTMSPTLAPLPTEDPPSASYSPLAGRERLIVYFGSILGTAIIGAWCFFA